MCKTTLELLTEHYNAILDLDPIVSFDIKRIGDFLGMGAYKEVYEDKEDNTRVIAISRDVEQIRREMVYYVDLAKYVRIPIIYEQYNIITCQIREKRIGYSIVVMERLYSINTLEELYNNNQLIDILFSLEYFNELQIYIDDLQLMKDKKDRVVFIDPLDMIFKPDNMQVIYISIRNNEGIEAFQLNYKDIDKYLNECTC